MKNKALIFLLACATISLFRPPAAAAAGSVSISFFYDELSPYGRWASVGRYGDCWIPEHVVAGWQPYTDGEWVYTDYGWTWVSYDPWGGDPYHYGTWVWEPPFGWVWVPGTVWGPSWVTWCYSDSYVGWAPIPPSLQIGYSGYYGPAVTVSRASYVFVPVNRFAGVRVNTARLPLTQNATLLKRTRRVTSFGVTNGIVVNRGPSVQRIEASAHMRIPRASIDSAKSRPVAMTAGGMVPRGKRLSIVAPASVRARELDAHAPNRGRSAAGGAGPAAGNPAVSREAAKPTRSGQATAGPGHRKASGTSKDEAAPREGVARHVSPPPHREKAPKHEAPPPHHEAAPLRHEAPPPHHDVAPKHEAPPLHHDAAPKHEAPPSHSEAPLRHDATPPGHAAPPAVHRQPPPRHEPPPPPPPHGSGSGAAGSATP
jgi:hypothetical protein